MSNIDITCKIENYYVDSDDTIVTTPTETVPEPEDSDWADDLDEWAQDNVFPLTGVGNMSGDATYDVTITASSNERLIGRTFEFGY